MFVFASILGLQARSSWLWPVTILLLPVALAFAMVGLVLYPISAVAGTTLWLRNGTRGAATDSGIEIRKGDQAQRCLPWGEIAEVVEVFQPPFQTYEAVLSSGETVPIDFLDGRDALASHGIAVRRELGVRQSRRTTA
jgi:hypothetical protein